MLASACKRRLNSENLWMEHGAVDCSPAGRGIAERRFGHAEFAAGSGWANDRGHSDALSTHDRAAFYVVTRIRKWDRIYHGRRGRAGVSYCPRGDRAAW